MKAPPVINFDKYMKDFQASNLEDFQRNLAVELTVIQSRLGTILSRVSKDFPNAAADFRDVERLFREPSKSIIDNLSEMGTKLNLVLMNYAGDLNRMEPIKHEIYELIGNFLKAAESSKNYNLRNLAKKLMDNFTEKFTPTTSV